MEKVADQTKLSLERGDSPLMWSIEVSRSLHSAGLGFPSLELAEALASCLFSYSPLTSLSTYLYHALDSQLVSSFHFIGLLTSRVLQLRRSYPDVYLLYLDLTSTYVFHIGYTKAMPSCNMAVKAVDEVLELSVLSGVSVSEFGTAAMQFLSILIWRLLEAVLEDWRSFYGNSDKQDKSFPKSVQLDSPMEVDDGISEQQIREHEQLQKTNWITAIRLIAKLLQNKKTYLLLRIAQRNLVKLWGMVTSCFQALDKIISDSLPMAAIEALAELLGSYQQELSNDTKGYQFPVSQVLIESRAGNWLYGNCSEVGRAVAWIPFDIFMEDVMVGTRIIATSVVEALAELVKSLQSFHDARWHDTFLALWISAVRLAQREMENLEGLRPLLGSRLSMPLAIVPLASTLLIHEEETMLRKGAESNTIRAGIDRDCGTFGSRRAAFVSSLKVLGQFEDLLALPQKLTTHVNHAAAATFASGFGHGNITVENVGISDGSSNLQAGGNLHNLIVETCIARGLLDTSAYFWPGCVGAAGSNISRSIPGQLSPWNMFMEGAPLTASLKNSLILSPAKSVKELERVYDVAISGPEEERPAAASILCGTSLMRSWNIQEHAVDFVVRLLSPPASNDGKPNGHYFIQHAPMLYATLGAIKTADALHVLSLYGRIFEVTAALLPICEVFGCLSPTMPLVTGANEEIPVLTMFSLAFLILIKICKFHRVPVEHWATGSGLDPFNDTCLEYLLVRHNMHVVSSLGISSEKKTADDLDKPTILSSSGSSKIFSQCTPPQYVILDSFPRLQAWFHQQKSCITTGSVAGVASADPVRQFGDRLLAMMLRKSNKSGSMPATSGASVSSTVNDDVSVKPLLPAWDLLAALPSVIDTMLTACAHGKIQPRDLTTGLRELVDFCPASIASIVTFLEAEVERGISRPAPMNGKAWPSPAANLLAMEAEIREMLSSSGVDVPSCVTGSNSGNTLVTLLLPMAALVSLTITFKVDKLSDLAFTVGGPALQNLAGETGCTAVVAALWTQKVRRWQDFIVFGSAVAALRKDKQAALQVLKNCFKATLGNTNKLLTAHGGVGGLLGHVKWMHPPSGGRGSIPPGILFLRVLPSLHDVRFLPSEIIVLLVKSVREMTATGSEVSFSSTLKNGARLRCLQSSLATVVSRVAQAATLSASLLFVSGGSILGHLLYSEALPLWFSAGHQVEAKPASTKCGNSGLLEGYAVAYFAVLSGMLIWSGASESRGQESVKISALSSHMRFVASVLDGKVSLACDWTTWQAYVRTFISLVLMCASSWISCIDAEILQRIATALRAWHDFDVALALLESGGVSTIHIAAEFALNL